MRTTQSLSLCSYHTCSANGDGNPDHILVVQIDRFCFEITESLSSIWPSTDTLTWVLHNPFTVSRCLSHAACLTLPVSRCLSHAACLISVQVWDKSIRSLKTKTGSCISRTAERTLLEVRWIENSIYGGSADCEPQWFYWWGGLWLWYSNQCDHIINWVMYIFTLCSVINNIYTRDVPYWHGITAGVVGFFVVT